MVRFFRKNWPTAAARKRARFRFLRALNAASERLQPMRDERAAWGARRLAYMRNAFKRNGRMILFRRGSHLSNFAYFRKRKMNFGRLSLLHHWTTARTLASNAIKEQIRRFIVKKLAANIIKKFFLRNRGELGLSMRRKVPFERTYR